MDPEILLLGEATGRGELIGQGLAIEGAFVIHHGDVVSLNGAGDVVVADLLVAQDIERAFHIRLGGLRHRALGLEALVFRHLELRSVLHGRRVGERQTTTKGQLLDIEGR